MRFLKRYRRKMTTRALKPASPLFVLEAEEVAAALTGGRL